SSEGRPDPERAQRADALERWLSGEASEGEVESIEDLLAPVVEARRAAAAARASDEARARVVSAEVLETLREGVLHDPALTGRRTTWSERMRAELSGSVALRVIAASVLAHVLALPAVAWLTWRPEPEPAIQIRIEPTVGDEREGDSETAEIVVGDDVASTDERIEPADARRLDRFRLDSADRPDAPIGGDRDTARFWFRWRLEGHGADGRIDRRTDFLPGDIGLTPADPLAQLALTDAALDRLTVVVDPVAVAIAQGGLERLRSWETLEGALAEAARRTIRRGARYGLVDDAGVAPEDSDPDPAAWATLLRDELDSREGWQPVTNWVDARR
ncbi:MAG: hypothetical protein ACYSWX_06145, partial [Planctomycetota bacterium]